MKNNTASDTIPMTEDAGGVSFRLASAPYIPHDDDSIERPTTLGIHLTNPYLIANMQKAYANLGLNSARAVVTNWYVRFLPSGIGQLATLDSFMDAQGLELFDTPMDYQITYEGDYYQDPSIPDSLPTWAYYIGHILSDKKYGTSAGCWSEQDGLPGTTYCNYNGTGHPHLDVEENFKVYPDKDSVNIGDTIYAEINIPTMLPDQNNKMIDYSKANNLSTDMGFVKLANISPIALDDAVGDFTFRLISGKEIRSSNPSLIKEYGFEETGGRYVFKLAIVPKTRGTFRFNFGNAANVMRKGNSCPKASFNFLLKNTTNQHYYLYPGGIGVTPAGADY